MIVALADDVPYPFAFPAVPPSRPLPPPFVLLPTSPVGPLHRSGRGLVKDRSLPILLQFIYARQSSYFMLLRGKQCT